MIELTAQLANARAATDALFATLQGSALFDRPVPERHRLIFYLGHLEAFDWNQVARFALGEASFHPSFDSLFEAGIDPEPGGGPRDAPGDWPSIAEIQNYTRETRRRINALLHRVPAEAAHMAIEHRWMHAETLAYLFHALPFESKKELGAQWNPASPRGIPKPGLVEVSGGSVTLGTDDTGTFGWDNEFPALQVSVPAFNMNRYKVTNGEYLAFVDQGAAVPHFWMRRDGEWHWRGMFQSHRLPLHSPVYVTHNEATAYAKWRGMTLPTEAQYHRAAYQTADSEETCYPWGSCPPETVSGNFGFRRFDPVPVDSTPGTDTAGGIAQLAGNGWEWTSTIFDPFPGFQASLSYPGYSANFFDGSHYVLKGASARTAPCFLRRSFRNWFRPDYPYAYSSFRCVQC